MDEDIRPSGAFQAPGAPDVFGSNPQYAQEYAQQLAEAQQDAADEQHERLYGPQLRSFWEGQAAEVESVGGDLAQFKNHQLPLARIKKIMKSDEDVRMISAEAPVLFAKACEMFILELTLRSWVHAEEARRRTLQRSDVATAITKDDAFDFLADIVPQEEPKPEGSAADGAAAGAAAAAADGLPAAAAAAAAAVPPLPGAYAVYGYPDGMAQQQQQQQQQWPAAAASASGDPSGQQSGELSGL